MNARAFALMASIVGLASAAAAGTLITPPMSEVGIPNGGSPMCLIANVSDVERTVVIEMWEGTYVRYWSSGEIILPPGGLSQRAPPARCKAPSECSWYCKFIFEGAARRVRAAGCMRAGETGCQYVVPAQ